MMDTDAHFGDWADTGRDSGPRGAQAGVQDPLEADFDWAPAIPPRRHPLDLQELRWVDARAVVRELAAAPETSAALVVAVVRAFAAAALRGPGARTRPGWDAAMRAVRVVLNGALHDGVREARLAGAGGLGDPSGMSCGLLYAVVRAHMAARFREPTAATAEGRSRAKSEVLELLWDALLDAVKRVPRPRPTAP